jgi:YrbI family 3-deoxy-D-manno-octulosonate 8-phosphate phosphatase
MWARLGLEIAVITGRNGMALRHRLRELGVRHVISGSKEKGGAFEGLLAELGVAADEAAMIGDDLPDLPILRRCGLPIAVRDASQEVLDVARFVTPRPGGAGAVRDAVEHILKAQGRWSDAVRLFDPEYVSPVRQAPDPRAAIARKKFFSPGVRRSNRTRKKFLSRFCRDFMVYKNLFKEEEEEKEENLIF